MSMVDSYQVVLAAIAVSIMIAIPLVCVALFDLAAGRWDEAFSRWRRKRTEAGEHKRNVRALRRPPGLPIERIAADLRRLRGVLANDANRSAAHQIGNRLAYDRVLMQACQMLDISHDLEEDSAGMERDIERLRVEAELERAGVVIATDRYGKAA